VVYHAWHSIAEHFDLDIYILNLASADDGILTSLFAKLPQHCVILLEDVNIASARSRMVLRGTGLIIKASHCNGSPSYGHVE
jgi:hypothetical protein